MSTCANDYKSKCAAVDTFVTVGDLFATIEPGLRAIVELRILQINGCFFQADEYAGETDRYINRLVAWDKSPLFDETERTALEWAEALTRISRRRAPNETYDALAYSTEVQIVDLTLNIADINAWSRIAIGHRMQPTKRCKLIITTRKEGSCLRPRPVRL